MSTKPDKAQAAPEAAGTAVAADEWGPIDTEVRRVKLKAIRSQPTNARFMTSAQMEQLAANIRTDGRLTSMPLLYADPASGELENLSGHHRVEAGIMAGLEEADAIVITTPLTQQRKRAIQLSHNAIVGQDDPTTLAAMYAGLDLSAKSYSGLDDSTLDVLKDVGLAGLSVGIKYQEMHLFFLPEDASVVASALGEIEAAARKNGALVAAYKDFDDFFDAAVKAKSKFQAFNSAIAMRLLVDLAMQKLAEMEAADGE